MQRFGDVLAEPTTRTRTTKEHNDDRHRRPQGPGRPHHVDRHRMGRPIARVWALWADPRKLERWWGPPTFPATVLEHDLRPGGKVSYYMTSPEGESTTDGGRSSRSTSRTASISKTASPTPTASPTTRCPRRSRPSPSPSCRAVPPAWSSRPAFRRASHGPDDRHGHGGGHGRGVGADRRHPRRRMT